MHDQIHCSEHKGSRWSLKTRCEQVEKNVYLLQDSLQCPRSANPWPSPPNAYVRPTDPRCVSPLLACCLIALDKNPGVRPIGIGETPRHIIAKALLETVGSTQLCADQITGTESAVHAVRECTKAVLLVDASNAFNSLNRNHALHNIQFECPAISTFLINTYREPSKLFIDGEVIYS